ncbi:uncharacterized protein BXZ73DRAFT_82699 [Epithele typhae]|uniref:uncharacterized protein n=1 Tax=Epithele typhae TaxID=378194 RepID=UPI0020086862|nr:uncharacterized protein BXZ73DRAFT_82699 [Epithele typhae]KAH9911562.1 hypothetical protein BXZ73DRAFT_82699 [Epithele typhae]
MDAILFHGEGALIDKPRLAKNSQNTVTGFGSILRKKLRIAPPHYRLQHRVARHHSPPGVRNRRPRPDRTRGRHWSAEGFVGKKVHGAFITAPNWFKRAQKDVLVSSSRCFEWTGAVSISESPATGLSAALKLPFVDGAFSLELPLPIGPFATLRYDDIISSAQPALGCSSPSEHLLSDCRFSPAVVGSGVGDPTTTLVRACAMQAIDPRRARGRYGRRARGRGDIYARRRSRRRRPRARWSDSRGTWVLVVLKDTPVLVRRIVTFDVDFGEGEGEGEKKVGFELYL